MDCQAFQEEGYLVQDCNSLSENEKHSLKTNIHIKISDYYEFRLQLKVQNKTFLTDMKT